jgi:hypothetical protein
MSGVKVSENSRDAVDCAALLPGRQRQRSKQQVDSAFYSPATRAYYKKNDQKSLSSHDARWSFPRKRCREHQTPIEQRCGRKSNPAAAWLLKNHFLPCSYF